MRHLSRPMPPASRPCGCSTSSSATITTTRPASRALARLLDEKHGLRVWLDKWECVSGKLEPQCEIGIKNSRFTVVVGSKTALKSKWVQWEIDKHNQLNPEGDRLIPIKFETLKLPPELDGLLWVDFTDPARDADNAALLARLIRSADAEDARRRRGLPQPGEARRGIRPIPTGAAYGFHGRARELYDLERRFRTERGIVLHAMGGMGKTALATEAAHWWTRSGLFRDGACFLSFEQFASADRVVQVLGTYLAGPKFDQLPAAEQRRRAIELFQQKDVLMVWDNFESALPQFTMSRAPPTPTPTTSAAASPSCSATSPPARARAACCVTCRPDDTGLPGAGRHELHGLARADSLWLLSQHPETRRPDPQRSPVRPRPSSILCWTIWPTTPSRSSSSARTCAPSRRRRSGPTSATLLAKFQQDAPEGRNQSLLASLEFSRRHLSPAARAALPWLGLFRGGVFEQFCST